MRRYFVLCTLLVCGVSPAFVMCQDESRHEEQVGETGQLKMPLETFGNSGNRYRLRDAIFIVDRRISGSGSGSGGFAGEATDVGFGGDSAVSVVTTGAFGSATSGFGFAATSGGTTGPAVGFTGVGGGNSVTVGSSVTGAGGSSGEGEFVTERVLFSEDALFDPFLIAQLRTGQYRVTLLPGWLMERITPEGDSAIVQAELTSSDQQFVEIFFREASFIFYSFLVDGDEVIMGSEGDLFIGIDVEEVNNTFNRRSLFETNAAAVQQFNLEETLDALGVNAGFEANGALLYQQLIDSYATAPGNLESAVHCGDENPGQAPTLNGYPIFCDRLEAQQFDNLGSWFATAVVNRIDLAPENAAHCGQQRIIFANNEFIGNGRMFMIVESQVPNPSPEDGLAGCLPVAEFWRSLEAVDDPVERGSMLHDAFLVSGVPGIGPFMNATRLTAGTGQIRTNNFNDFIWTLREFKLVQDDQGVRAIPFPTAEAPHGPLWNDNLEFPFGPACRESFLRAVDGVLSDNPAEMAFIVDHECKDAESPNDFFTQNYPFHLFEGNPDGFQAELATRLEGTGLTPFELATRAQFAGSCIGCHQEAIGVDLGNGVSSPFSRGFVHVDEFFLEECDGGQSCFPISQALTDVFLPHRGQVMTALLGDGEGGAGGAFGDNVSVSVTTVGSGGTSPGNQTGNVTGGIIPEPGLASAELSVEELVEVDEAAKDAWGRRTLGGQPAQVSH